MHFCIASVNGGKCVWIQVACDVLLQQVAKSDYYAAALQIIMHRDRVTTSNCGVLQPAFVAVSVGSTQMWKGREHQ